MPTTRWISLTTDYGLRDGFVAACHGVIARLAPDVRVIDVTHLVPPADLRHGAAVLAQTVPHLPPAVHVAVVDPGVGTARRGIALDTPGGQLVGPDNGLLLPAAEALGGIRVAVELANPRWLASLVSATFHGRDVFAPVAARLATGAPLAEAGPAIDPAGLVHLPPPVLEVAPEGLTAQVLTVDHFGNVQLAAPASVLEGRPPMLRVAVPARDPGESHDAVHARTFADVPPGALLVYADSAGHVSLAINQGRAAERLGVRPGDTVRIRHVD